MANKKKKVITDSFYLGEGAVYPADPRVSGINGNVAIVGGTGVGKTFSCVLPLLLNNTCQSMVVPINKRSIIDQTRSTLIEHGYDVEVVDFAKGESTIGFNPLKFIHDEQDAGTFGRTIVGKICDNDPYWDITSINVISALAQLEVLTAREYKTTPQLSNFLHNYRKLSSAIFGNGRGSSFSTRMPESVEDLDNDFEFLETLIGPNGATTTWKSLPFKADKTISSIMSTLNVGMSQFTDSVTKSAEMANSIDFEALGQKKTVLFVVTSPFDVECSRYVNLFYSMLLKELMNLAASKPDYKLDIPVQIIFDDFACGTPIVNFDRYISIFRAAGISTILLLQSESQLEAIYEKAGATTILNNCDTYVYMGGNDLGTCLEVARRCNKDASSILNMELNKVIIFRRGAEPVFTGRYPILKDKAYIKIDTERS